MVEVRVVDDSNKNEKVEAESKATSEPEGGLTQKGDDGIEETGQEEDPITLLEAKETEVAEINDRLLRTQAEFENYKKRIQREKEDTIKFCNESLLREFLPVVDNLEMAIQHGKDSTDPKSLTEGVEIVLNQFLKTLEKFSVTGFSSIGEKFDPNRHEAMMQVEDNRYDSNSIVSEFQKGYFLNDRLLRPAKVTVATSPSDTNTKNEDITDEK